MNNQNIELAGNMPKETLYVNNLNEKISMDDLKYGLYFLFQQFGEIIEIITKKQNALRGQAWLVFKDITSATNAKKMLNGFHFYGKELQINFSKQRSEILDKLEGKWVPKKKHKRDNTLDQQKEKQEKGQQKQDHNLQQQQQYQQQFQQQKNIQELNEQNNVLMLEDLPSFISSEILMSLFSQYPGFKEVRLIQARRVGFVEFENEDQATVALHGLQHFQITQDSFLKINYAKF